MNVGILNTQLKCIQQKMFNNDRLKKLELSKGIPLTILYP